MNFLKVPPPRTEGPIGRMTDIFIGYKISVQGRFVFDFWPYFWNLSISRWKWPCQEKTDHFMCSCFSHAESARVFPALFPGISAQKKQHMLTQSRVRSNQKVQDTKLITIGKTWPFPGPPQEIRPKGRNLANGQLCVSFRRSRCIIDYNYMSYDSNASP